MSHGEASTAADSMDGRRNLLQYCGSRSGRCLLSDRFGQPVHTTRPKISEIPLNCFGGKRLASHSAVSASYSAIRNSDPGTGANIVHNPGTEDEKLTQGTPLGAQDPGVRLSSSSSPDEAVVRGACLHQFWMTAECTRNYSTGSQRTWACRWRRLPRERTLWWIY